MVSNNRGIALVIVLWAMVLLSTMAMAMLAAQRSELQVLHNNVDRARALALAEAGIFYGIINAISYRDGQDIGWRANGQTHQWGFADEEINISISDESSRVNLNQVAEDMLDRLLEAVGIEQDGVAMRDAILDWRDDDNIHRLDGAEDEEYAAAGLAYGARDGQFKTVAELRQVLGVKQEDYQKLEPLFTVHSRTADIHTESAASPVLLALPGMTPEIVEEYMVSRDQHIAQGLDPPPLPGAGKNQLKGNGSGMFRVVSNARRHNANVTLEAVVQKGGPLGFTVIDWKNASAGQDAGGGEAATDG